MKVHDVVNIGGDKNDGFAAGPYVDLALSKEKLPIFCFNRRSLSSQAFEIVVLKSDSSGSSLPAPEFIVRSTSQVNPIGISIDTDHEVISFYNEKDGHVHIAARNDNGDWFTGALAEDTGRFISQGYSTLSVSPFIAHTSDSSETELMVQIAPFHGDHWSVTSWDPVSVGLTPPLSTGQKVTAMDSDHYPIGASLHIGLVTNVGSVLFASGGFPATVGVEDFLDVAVLAAPVNDRSVAYDADDVAVNTCFREGFVVPCLVYSLDGNSIVFHYRTYMGWSNPIQIAASAPDVIYRSISMINLSDKSAAVAYQIEHRNGGIHSLHFRRTTPGDDSLENWSDSVTIYEESVDLTTVDAALRSKFSTSMNLVSDQQYPAIAWYSHARDTLLYVRSTSVNGFVDQSVTVSQSQVSSSIPSSALSATPSTLIGHTSVSLASALSSAAAVISSGSEAAITGGNMSGFAGESIVLYVIIAVLGCFLILFFLSFVAWRLFSRHRSTAVGANRRGTGHGSRMRRSQQGSRRSLGGSRAVSQQSMHRGVTAGTNYIPMRRPLRSSEDAGGGFKPGYTPGPSPNPTIDFPSVPTPTMDQLGGGYQNLPPNSYKSYYQQ